MALLTKREKEFIQDWFRVLDGEMGKIEFFEKWASKKDGANFIQDLELVESGEMSLEEFRAKWSSKGDWKNYIRVMRHRLEKKYKEGREELILLYRFLNLRDHP